MRDGFFNSNIVTRTGGLEPADTAYVWSYAHLGLSIASLAMSYLFFKEKACLQGSVEKIFIGGCVDAWVNASAASIYSREQHSSYAVCESCINAHHRNSYIVRVGYLIR